MDPIYLDSEHIIKIPLNPKNMFKKSPRKIPLGGILGFFAKSSASFLPWNPTCPIKTTDGHGIFCGIVDSWKSHDH